MFCENIAKFIRESPNIIHLSLSSMGIKKGLTVIKDEGIDRSRSLQCINLSGNIFDSQAATMFARMAVNFSTFTKEHQEANPSLSLTDFPDKDAHKVVGEDKSSQTSIAMIKIINTHLQKATFL